MDPLEVELLMAPGVDISLLRGYVLRPAWQRRAACRGQGPEMFFARLGDDGAAVQAGKAVCQTCPVQPECLAFALADPMSRGVWGGTSQETRQAMRRASA